MARYTIDFSTNASAIVKQIEEVNKRITELARTGSRKIELQIDTRGLRASFDSTFRELDAQIDKMQRRLSGLQIGSRRFQEQATAIGITQGLRERGGLQSRAIQLGAQAGAFDPGSIAQLQRQLEAARIEASQLTPNTQEWVKLQQQIGQINAELRVTDKLAENVQLTQQLGAFAPGSLNQLEAKLIVLRNRAREISPNTPEWQKLNKEIVQLETNIQKQTRAPLSKGQRLGAAGGALLYGGGLGGGVGSAVGGIAGGLLGGVPGAFTGAAVGQTVDSLTALTSSIVEQATAVQKLRLGLAAASNNLTDYAESVRQVEAISTNLLLPIEEVTRKYTQLRASTVALGIDTQTTGEIFQGTAAAVLQSGGSLEDVDGAMRAVVQVFSKGKLTAEELRGQLGERLPGAVVDFAKSAGMSVQELDKAFEAGTTSIDDFVKFLREKKGDTQGFVDELATSSEFAGARLAKAFERIKLSVGQSLQPTGAAIQDFVTRSLNGFDKLIRKAIELELIQPGAGFFEQQALLGADGGIAGLEQRLLQAGAEETAARQQAQAAGLGFVENLLPKVADATKKVKVLEQALKNLRKAEGLTSTRQSQQLQKDEADKRSQQFLDLVERREESIAQARQKYEEDIANIRENAIKEAEALERNFNDKRLQAEQEIARTRRELAASKTEQGLIRRELTAGITGEDTSLIEQERQIGQIINDFTEQKISLEEKAQQEQLSLSRELEDFKRKNADAINQANERYAKAIGEIQKNYAKAVAKLIEDGSGNGAKKLAAAGKLIAAQIARASAQEAFVTATGGAIIPRGAGVYEVGGRQLTESKLLAAAEKSTPATKTAAKAFVDATKQIEAAQKELNTAIGARATIVTPQIKAVDTSDLDRRIEDSADKLSVKLQEATSAGQELNIEDLFEEALRVLRDTTDEGRKRIEDLTKENNLILEQVDLIKDGTLPALAEQEAVQESIFLRERNSLLNQVKKYENLIKANESLTEAQKGQLLETITKELNKQLGVLDKQLEIYKQLDQQARDNAATLQATQLRAQIPNIGAGLRAGFLNEAGAAFEEQISRGVSREAAANVAKATEELTLAKFAADGLQDAANGVGDAFAQSFSDVITGAQTAQASLLQFFQNIGKSFADLAAQLIAKFLLLKAVGIIASFFPSAPSSPGNTAQPGGALQLAPQVNAGTVNSANGNVLVGGFQAFAKGGVVTGPTLGLIGEGRFNEAVVPLPDGRKIPVDLGNSAGNNISTNIVVNVSNGQASSQVSGGGGQALGRELEGAVRSVILREARPGGIIYNAR